MSKLDHDVVADTILAAPAWARVGITAPKAELRADAARELARWILDGEGRPTAELDDQLQLRL